jgi:hypothetical protein
MVGQDEEAVRYKTLATEMARRWVEMADDGGHYRLTFDRPGTWSMKYNLVWDRLFELGLFPGEVAEKEVAHYLRVQNTYGLPLDSRADFTKSDWLVWSASLASSDGDFRALILPLYRFVQETPDRVPFSDWYETTTARHRNMQARPVIGALFIKFLADRELWKKWASQTAIPGE